MNQNARSTNMTDADSPMLSMVEFLNGTGRKKKGIAHSLPMTPFIATSILLQQEMGSDCLDGRQWLWVWVLIPPTPPDPTSAFLSYMNIAIVDLFT